MDRLPVEIIEKILIDPRVCLEDVLAFSSVCHHFREIVYNSNKIWKLKLFQRYLLLGSVYTLNFIISEFQVAPIEESP